MQKAILTLFSFLLLFRLKAQQALAAIFEGIGDGETTDAQAGSGLVRDALDGAGVTPQDGDFASLIIQFVNFTLPYLALAAFVGYVYAGILYVGAFGNEEALQKSKKILIFSTAGLLLVILSYTIVNLLTGDLVDFINNPDNVVIPEDPVL